MMRDFIRELRTWFDANAECGRARAEWLVLRDHYLQSAMETLSPKERLHIRHTVFRINGLMYLYAKLRRAQHNTQLGVLCGLVTHLLDYAYDYCSLSEDELDHIERVTCLQDQPNPNNSLETALYELCKLTWSIVPNPHLVQQALATMLRTQRESLVQNNIGKGNVLSGGELKQITFMKGHHSICLYFSIANPLFSSVEARHLESFGYYMQYMDDLEDFYEDRAEARTSSVSTVHEGLHEAYKLLIAARPDLATFYDNPRYDYDLVWGKLIFYHRALCVVCVIREWIRRLPQFMQRGIHKVQEGVSSVIPFIYTAPID